MRCVWFGLPEHLAYDIGVSQPQHLTATTWSGGPKSRYNVFVAEATARQHDVPFGIMAAGCSGAALYHLAALSIPAFAKFAYPPTYPLLRHVTFIIADGLAALLFLLRPRWFIWPYLALTVQVLQGHGARGYRTWVQKHELNWIDVITVFGVFIGLVLLVLDRRLAQKRENFAVRARSDQRAARNTASSQL